jgi:DNA-binding NarL/FixJ family response regulator
MAPNRKDRSEAGTREARQVELRGLPNRVELAAKKRILIVDDHPMMRLGLSQVFKHEPGLEVCGEAGSPAEALQLISTCRPDLVLTDITLKGGNGLELIRDLVAIQAGLPILVVSMHDETVYAERALRAGARGYIMKEETGEHLVGAVRQVLAGGIYLSERESARVVEGFASPKARAAGAPFQRLSDREFQIFELIGQGKTSHDIGALLRLSSKTVDTHRANIRQKLGLESGAALFRHAVQWVSSGSPI